MRLRASSFLALLAATALVALLPAHACADERIESFHSEIDVRADGDLVVTETIDVRAEQRSIRRGIYRDFPLTFVDAEGRTRRVDFELLAMLRNGAPEPHHERENAKGIRIYAGDENVLLPPGTWRYVFRYRTGRQLRSFPDHVELNWNVTGNEWIFPIRSAGALVRLPGNAKPVRWTAFTGRHGERGTAFRVEPKDDGSLAFATTRELAPGEGFTVVVQLPDGVVAAPTQLQQWRWTILDHGRSILAALGLAAVLVFYLTAWNAVGRDPPKGTIIPLFHPPPGISPALAAYIRQWGWSGEWREWTATAVSLAVKGLIVFDDRDGLRLERTPREATAGEAMTNAAPNASTNPTASKTAATWLDPGERSLLSWIDREGGSVRVDREHGKRLAAEATAFRNAIERDNRDRFFRRNGGWFMLGLLFTGASLALVFAFGRLEDNEITLLVIAGFIGLFAGSALAHAIRTLFGHRGVAGTVGAILRLAVFVAVAFGASTLFVGDLVFDEAVRSTMRGALVANLFPLALVGGFGLLNAVFWYLLRAPTAAGRKVMDEIEGLELYLRTAETARMNLPQAPEITTTNFERLLPYAIALGLEKPWSQAFEAAFARAHPGESLDAAYRPGWHGGRGWSGSGGFGRSLSASMGAAQGAFASAVPAPSSSSSGFSGGGGSGGGGGGGGGGGW